MSEQTQKPKKKLVDDPPKPIKSGDVRWRLEAIKEATDNWVAAHTDQYDPFDWGDLEKRAVRRKALCEAAVYLHVAESAGDLATEELKSLVVDRVNDPRYYHLLARKPQEIHKFGYPVAYVKNHADLDDAAAAAMERSLERPSVWGLERRPFRTLDVWHLCRMYGYDDHGVDFRSVLESSCAKTGLSPIESSLENTYELTHVFMFYHNFGSGSERFPAEPMGYEHPETLVGLLLRYISEENCDIVGELLFCAALERQLPPGLVRFALGWLFEKMDESGYVPGPEDGGLPVGAVKGAPELEDLEMAEWDDESETWGRNYHPTMVTSMMVRALLDAWDEIDRPERRLDLDYEAQGANLVKVGEALTKFAAYDLKAGAELFVELAETPVFEAFPDLFEVMAEFLEHQKRPDGEFGYWTDEEQVYLSLDENHDQKTFRTEMLQPTSRACAAALDAFGTGRREAI